MGESTDFPLGDVDAEFSGQMLGRKAAPEPTSESSKTKLIQGDMLAASVHVVY